MSMRMSSKPAVLLSKVLGVVLTCCVVCVAELGLTSIALFGSICSNFTVCALFCPLVDLRSVVSCLVCVVCGNTSPGGVCSVLSGTVC